MCSSWSGIVSMSTPISAALAKVLRMQLEHSSRQAAVDGTTVQDVQE